MRFNVNTLQKFHSQKIVLFLLQIVYYKLIEDLS